MKFYIDGLLLVNARSASNFEEVLLRQHAESQLENFAEPEEGEADHLFLIKDNEEVASVIKEIILISKGLSLL